MYRRQKDKANCSHSARYRKKKTIELLFIACVQPPLPSNKIDFVWGRGGLCAGYSWQTGSLRYKFNKLHPLMPTQPAQQELYLRVLGIEARSGREALLVSLSACLRWPDITETPGTSAGTRTSDIRHQISDIGNNNDNIIIYNIYRAIIPNGPKALIRHLTSYLGYQTSDFGHA